jgi:diketogulonate reductase-like aldo/keto reductase
MTAYSPLAQGKIKDDLLLQEIGKKYQKSTAQVTLRWLIQQPKVLAIPQSKSHEHRVQNFDIFDFELSREEMEAIHALERGVRLCYPEWSPDWNK